MTTKQRTITIFSIAGLLLAIPFVAMQFTDEVIWSPFDFIVAGGLLFSTAISIEAMFRLEKRTKHRIGIIAVILLVLFLLWAELAVGIFGSAVAGN